MSHARACDDVKLNRTLGESLTHWRVRQQPRKKNTPCISDFARAGFFLLKGTENFLCCFALNEQGGWAGLCLISFGCGGIPPSATSSLGRTEILAVIYV